jgi:Domain of unknown function (DUF397)
MTMDSTPVLWRKSSYSGSGNNCVETATADQVVLIRDSKDQGGPQLRLTAEQWRSFTAAVKDGALDLR